MMNWWKHSATAWKQVDWCVMNVHSTLSKCTWWYTEGLRLLCKIHGENWYLDLLLNSQEMLKSNLTAMHCNVDLPRYFKPEGSFYTTTPHILHAWTVNSVSRLSKNSKHITAITFPSKPTFTHPHQVIWHLWCTLVKFVLAFLTTCLRLQTVNVRFGWNSDCCNVIRIVNQSVHKI